MENGKWKMRLFPLQENIALPVSALMDSGELEILPGSGDLLEAC